MKFFKPQNKKGFTLIEVVIAVGLFAVVMTIALAVILSVVANNKKTQVINAVVNNLNFALDSMVRDIKTGYSYTCHTSNIPLAASGDNNCGVNDQTSIILVSTLYSQPKIVSYYFEKGDPLANTIGKIKKITCESVGAFGACSGASTDIEVTSPEIDIKDMQILTNIGTPGSSQPSVFLLIHGTSAVNPTEASDFTVQTLISQRRLNI